MVRLIDTIKTVTNLSRRITPLIEMGENPMRVYEEVLQVIAESPTVDAVAVVRCRECKHLKFSDCYGECGEGHMSIVSPDDFCSYGRRKEGAD